MRPGAATWTMDTNMTSGGILGNEGRELRCFPEPGRSRSQTTSLEVWSASACAPGCHTSSHRASWLIPAWGSQPFLTSRCHHISISTSLHSASVFRFPSIFPTHLILWNRMPHRTYISSIQLSRLTRELRVLSWFCPRNAGVTEANRHAWFLHACWSELKSSSWYSKTLNWLCCGLRSVKMSQLCTTAPSSTKCGRESQRQE